MNDLIDFNRIDSRELTIDRSIFILQHLVADIKTLFSQSMAKDGVDFVVDTSGISESDFGDGTLLLLDADEGKIRRIVINILSNVSVSRFHFLDSIVAYWGDRHSSLRRTVRSI